MANSDSIRNINEELRKAMDIKRYIGETTEYDKKQEVERRKVKSWHGENLRPHQGFALL